MPSLTNALLSLGGSHVGTQIADDEKQDPHEYRKKFYSNAAGIPSGYAAAHFAQKKAPKVAEKVFQLLLKKGVAVPRASRLATLSAFLFPPLAAGLASSGVAYGVHKAQEAFEKESSFSDALRTRKLKLALLGILYGTTTGYASDIDGPTPVSNEEEVYARLTNAMRQGTGYGHLGYVIGSAFENPRTKAYKGARDGGAVGRSNPTEQYVKNLKKKGVSAKDFAKKYHPDVLNNLDAATKAERMKDIGGDVSNFETIYKDLKKAAFYLGYIGNALSKFKWPEK